jgi:hypothetical protein
MQLIRILLFFAAKKKKPFTDSQGEKFILVKVGELVVRVIGVTFPVVMDNTTSRHVPVRTFFQSDGAPPHFTHRVRTFLGREIPDR